MILDADSAVHLAARLSNTFLLSVPVDSRLSTATGGKPQGGQGELLFRFTGNGKISNEASFDFAYAVGERISSSHFLASRQESAPSYRIADFNTALNSAHCAENFCLSQNLDRLFITHVWPRFEMVVGRQAISFGTAKFFDVVDMVSPFPIEALNKEDKFGVDALRLRVPVGNFNEVDVAVVAAPSKNNRFELGLAYVRSQFVFGRFTSDVMALRFQKNAMLGFSCAGAVGDVGVWGDAAATLVGAFGKTPYENQTQKDEPNYQRFTVGVDSKWGEKLTLQGEYGFNGAGKWAVSDYALLPTTTPYTHGRVFLVGRHYVGVQGTYETENRWSPSLKSVLNVMDFSGMVSPAVIFDATNSYDFAAGANISFGKKSETTSLGMPALRSEYGSVPRIFYAQTRVTF